MKTTLKSEAENSDKEINGAAPISVHRVKEIMEEEGINYTDEELDEVLDFLFSVVSITTAHYERKKQNETKVISIKTNATHETKSIPLYPCQHRRTG
jgi:hypothetical protein